MNSSPIKLLAEGLHVIPVLNALNKHPELWDQRTLRTENEDSPHYGLSDIWARYAVADGDAYTSHQSIWYDDVTKLVPIIALTNEVLKFFPGEVGGVLITKIKAGKLCRPHIDIGWHAKYYHKIGVSIAANDKQAFCFDQEFLVTKPGDAFWFDNSFTHWVPNISNEDRITAIICIRPESKE